MSADSGEEFLCPNCGEPVPAKARSCPECGSDENTGWSEQTYLDGVSLPYADDDDEDEPPQADPDAPPKTNWGLALIAGGILVVSLLIFLVGRL